MKTLKKVLFILISTIFMISCTAADIDNFLKPETDTEKAYSPRNFTDIFIRNLNLKEIKKEMKVLLDQIDGKKFDEFLNNKKTGELKEYHKNGKIGFVLNIQKGILKSVIYYDENGIKRMSFTENEAKAYYKSGKKAVFFKYNKSLNLYNLELEDPDEQIAYYEDGRKAMEIDNTSKIGRIYHKDGRLFFEFSGSLDNYKRYD